MNCFFIFELTEKSVCEYRLDTDYQGDPYLNCESETIYLQTCVGKIKTKANLDGLLGRFYLTGEDLYDAFLRLSDLPADTIESRLKGLGIYNNKYHKYQLVNADEVEL